MKLRYILGIISLTLSSFAFSSSCSSVVEKLSGLAKIELSTPLHGRAIKQVLMVEEKQIPKYLISQADNRAKSLSNGDDLKYQKLVFEPFIYALLICRENHSLSYTEAFEQALATLKGHDDG